MGFIFSMRSISSHSTSLDFVSSFIFSSSSQFFASLRSKKTKQVAVDGEKTSLFSASQRICYSSHDDVGRMKKSHQFKGEWAICASAASRAVVRSVSGRTLSLFLLDSNLCIAMRVDCLCEIWWFLEFPHLTRELYTLFVRKVQFHSWEF